MFLKRSLENKTMKGGIVMSDNKQNITVDTTGTSPALLPTKPEMRKLTMAGYIIIWAAMVTNMGGFTMGAQFVPALSPMMFVLVILVAYTLVTGMIALTGDIGIKYGIPWSAYIRAPFGVLGARIPTVARVLPCFFWCGFQTWLGATAISVVTDMIFGWSNVTLVIIILMILQVLNAALGMGAIAKFDWIAVPCLGVMIVAVAVYSLTSTGTTIPQVFAIPATGGGNFLFAVTSIAGIWITMGLNNLDITRSMTKYPEHDNPNFFTRNRKIIFGAVIGLILCGASVLLTGMISGLLTGVWNPIDIIRTAFDDNVLILILAMLCVVFAQWSTNTAAALMPGGYLLCNIFPKLNYKGAVIVTGIIACIVSLLIVPLGILRFVATITAVFAALVGPIGGILIADYYLLRKRNLDLNLLYDRENNKVNPRALIVYIPCTILSLIFVTYAFFVGFGLSLITYYLIMKNQFNSDGAPKNAPAKQ